APATTSSVVGGSQQFVATLTDANGNVLSGRTISWVSSAPSTATVSASGLASALAVGTASVTATSEGITGSAAFAVTAPPPAPVAHVTLTPSSASVAVGGSQQFVATLTDANGNVLSGRTISWVSSAPSIATVSASGLASALAVGTASVTATSEGINGSAAFAVTAPPPAPVAHVTLTPSSASVAVGGSQQFVATLTDANGNVLSGRTISWVSSAPSIAAVSAGR